MTQPLKIIPEVLTSDGISIQKRENITVELKAKLIVELNTGEHGFIKRRGEHLMLDRRRFRNREVLNWAFSRAWLTSHPGERDNYCFSGEPVYEGLDQPRIDDLDAEVLWVILKDTLSTNPGYSVIRNPVWEKLGIDRYGSSRWLDDHWKNEFITLIHRTLCRLDQANYIWFQAGGSVWRKEEGKQ